MNKHNILNFEGCFNVRDLYGLKTSSGLRIKDKVLVRSDSIQNLSAKGWNDLNNYGICTIIDLRNENEISSDLFSRPSNIDTINIPLDGNFLDEIFWSNWRNGPKFCTPMYYIPHLKHFPKVNSLVIKEIANAKPGGILFHCKAGRDRTGLIAMLLLASLDIADDDIVKDYEMSKASLSNVNEVHKINDEEVIIQNFLNKERVTTEFLLRAALKELKSSEQLLSKIASKNQISKLSVRFLEKVT